MAIYTIGDPHLALGCDKPMDIFPGWEGYLPRFRENWEKLVQPQDTVVLAGDISWAMKLVNTGEDFYLLEKLPGRKILLKGNHDLWWTTLSKMESFCEEKGFSTIHFLHNNCYLAEGLALCGTRGWMAAEPQGHDAKMMAREAGRLAASLKAAELADPQAEKVVFLHFPPFYSGVFANELVEVMQSHGVRRCYYGHLHSSAIRFAVEGRVDGIEYRLVSADALMFCPLQIIVEKPPIV